jgi:hypothetical protein
VRRLLFLQLHSLHGFKLSTPDSVQVDLMLPIALAAKQSPRCNGGLIFKQAICLACSRAASS